MCAWCYVEFGSLCCDGDDETLEIMVKQVSVGELVLGLTSRA